MTESIVTYVKPNRTDAGAVPVNTQVATHTRVSDGASVQDIYSELLESVTETRAQTPTATKAINVQIGPGDVISNIPVVLDFGQHQVHEGEAHSWEYYSAAPATRNFAIVVPVFADETKCPHMMMHMQSYGGAGMLSVYEGATYTGGTTATDVFNRNRNSTTVPGVVIVDGVTSSNGTKLPYTAIAGAAEKTADGVRANDEFILKSNTTYVVRYEEITATTRLVIHFEWYEDRGL